MQADWCISILFIYSLDTFQRLFYALLWLMNQVLVVVAKSIRQVMIVLVAGNVKQFQWKRTFFTIHICIKGIKYI